MPSLTALIILDKLDNKLIFANLINSLKAHGIDYLIYDDFNNLKEAFKLLDKNKNYLYYPNISIDYPLNKIKSIYENNKFDYIKTGNFIIAFKPKNVKIGRDGFYSMASTPPKYFMELKPFDKVVRYFKPKIDKKEIPRVTIYSHNRDIYLKLTLNSLIHSLKACPEIPITIFLNQPTKEVTQVAYEFLDKYPQVDILKSEKNVAFLAPNLAIQWFKNRNNIFMEDDMILPPALEHCLPMWAYQFVERLKTIDFISCRVSFSNVPHSCGQNWVCPNETHIGWKYYSDKNLPNILAQMFAVTSKFYIDLFDEKPVIDSTYLKNSKQIAIPNFQGYHIGWNQIQDNYHSLANWLDSFKMKNVKTKVTDVRTSESRILFTKEIKNIVLD